MSHPLDTPIWSALTTSHAALAHGGGGALRYPRDISPFAAAADDRPETQAALSGLVAPDETVVLVRHDPIMLPDGLVAETAARAVQMVATQRLAPLDDPRLVRLGEADESEMYDLAMLTRPGPFARRSMRLGRFWGIRQHGRLVAMAGERLRQGSWTELSGVCTHPEARGQGLARLLSTHVAAHIAMRGEAPYLHAFESNAAAIGLYESLGFSTRAIMNVVVARRT